MSVQQTVCHLPAEMPPCMIAAGSPACSPTCRYRTPRCPDCYRAFADAAALARHLDPSRPCCLYVPSEDYGSICSRCKHGAERHRSFNPQGGAW